MSNKRSAGQSGLRSGPIGVVRRRLRQEIHQAAVTECNGLAKPNAEAILGKIEYFSENFTSIALS
jgi:hypothetical protein